MVGRQRSNIPNYVQDRLYLFFGPVSTASVERLFSMTGRICSDRRSCLKPETVEIIALLLKRVGL